MEEKTEEEMVGAGFCDTCGRELYGKNSCRVRNPCPSDETDDSDDPETEVRESEVRESEVHESEVHKCEVHESKVHESMAQAHLKA